MQTAENLRLENFSSLILMGLTLNSNSRFAIRNLRHRWRDSDGSAVAVSIGRELRLATAHRPFGGCGPPLGKQQCPLRRAGPCRLRRTAGRGSPLLAGVTADSDVRAII